MIKKKLSKMEKIAALFLIMGKESAVQLVDYFSHEQLQKIVETAQNLPPMSFQDVEEIVKEFGDNYRDFGLIAGSENLSKYLVKETPGSNSASVQNSDPDSKKNTQDDYDVKAVVEFLQVEPAHLGALLFGAFEDDFAAMILEELDPELRNQILYISLNRKMLNEDLKKQLELSLLEMIVGSEPDEGNKVEIERAASLINQLSTDNADLLVEYLEKTNPENAAAIRKSLFKFVDIELLAKADRSVLFDSVQTSDLSIALANASDSLKESVFEILSQRNQRMVESEIARGSNSLDETTKVQRLISGAALKLAREGQITLPEAN